MRGEAPLRRVALGENTCGQAAVACVVASASEASVTADFPPDVPFGLGTSGPRIIAALRAQDVAATWIHGGWFGRGATPARARLVAHLATGQHAILCLDAGRLGGAAFSAHWAVATGLVEDGIVLRNLSQDGAIQWPEFMASWRCPHLPWRYNHCALLVHPDADNLNRRTLRWPDCSTS